MRVALGDPRDQHTDLAILPGRREVDVDPFTIVVKAPRWRPPNGPDLPLAEVYRHALDVATQRQVSSITLPSALCIGVWPMSDVTRIAMTVLMSTPSTVRDVVIAVPTPAMLEVWAEALAREP